MLPYSEYFQKANPYLVVLSPTYTTLTTIGIEQMWVALWDPTLHKHPDCCKVTRHRRLKERRIT